MKSLILALAAAYLALGLLWAGFVGVFAWGQGDPQSLGKLAWTALSWPYHLASIFIRLR